MAARSAHDSFPNLGSGVGPQEDTYAFVRVSIKCGFREAVLVSEEHCLVQGDRKDQAEQVLGRQVRILQKEPLLGTRLTQGECQLFGCSFWPEFKKRFSKLRESPGLADHQSLQLEDVGLHHSLQEEAGEGPKLLFKRPFA